MLPLTLESFHCSLLCVGVGVWGVCVCVWVDVGVGVCGCERERERESRYHVVLDVSTHALLCLLLAAVGHWRQLYCGHRGRTSFT